ncbi:MAG: hypothetical protein II140_06610 [Paludibacteraceae bacterium]|nr:hypothetical protein [Paludibacteraceae bacterium]
MAPKWTKWAQMGALVMLACVSCTRASKLDEYKAQKHERDSVGLVNQERSILFYQSQLDSLLPVIDSLLPMFKYEKNEQYQDHGYYVLTGRNGLRVMVRDDGQEPILMYRNGQRVENADDEAVDKALHLAVVMRDIKELEKRIDKTSLEIQKYQKRLQKE